MDTIVDGYRPRPFLCRQCGLILGWIVRDFDRITHVNVLRMPSSEMVMPTPVKPFERAQVWSLVNGNDGDVLCCDCGAVNPWVASQSALDEMLTRRQARMERKING